MCSEPPSDQYLNCKTTHADINYRGKTKYTQKGYTCKPWTLTKLKDEHYRFPDDTVDEAFNYCRNPYNSTVGPWCFITEHIPPYWDFCG